MAAGVSVCEAMHHQHIHADAPSGALRKRGLAAGAEIGMAIKDDLLYVADPRAKAVFTIEAAGKISKLAFQADE